MTGGPEEWSRRSCSSERPQGESPAPTGLRGTEVSSPSQSDMTIPGSGAAAAPSRTAAPVAVLVLRPSAQGALSAVARMLPTTQRGGGAKYCSKPSFSSSARAPVAKLKALPKAIRAAAVAEVPSKEQSPPAAIVTAATGDGNTGEPVSKARSVLQGPSSASLSTSRSEPKPAEEAADRAGGRKRPPRDGTCGGSTSMAATRGPSSSAVAICRACINVSTG